MGLEGDGPFGFRVLTWAESNHAQNDLVHEINVSLFSPPPAALGRLLAFLSGASRKRAIFGSCSSATSKSKTAAATGSAAGLWKAERYGWASAAYLHTPPT